MPEMNLPDPFVAQAQSRMHAEEREHRKLIIASLTRIEAAIKDFDVRLSALEVKKNKKHAEEEAA